MGLSIAPVFRITANSEDATLAIRERFVSLRITDQAGNDSDKLTLVLSDHDPLAPIALPPTGAQLEVWLGYDDQAAKMGTYIVDGVELSWPPNQIRIKAAAAPLAVSAGGDGSSGPGSQRPQLQGQKTRSWESGTLIGDLVRTVASEHGLEPAVGDTLAPIALPHIDQIAESDMQLLTRLAYQYDAIAKPGGGALVFAKRAASKAIAAISGSGESGASLPTVTITPDMVTTGRMTLSKRKASGSVTARWRDVADAVTHEIKVGEGEPAKHLSELYPDAATATAAARSELNRGARGEQTLRLTLPGRTDLMAEGRMALAGFREGADGEWLITQVEHSLDSGGYRCSVQAELPEG